MNAYLTRFLENALCIKLRRNNIFFAQESFYTIIYTVQAPTYCRYQYRTKNFSGRPLKYLLYSVFRSNPRPQTQSDMMAQSLQTAVISIMYTLLLSTLVLKLSFLQIIYFNW